MNIYMTDEQEIKCLYRECVQTPEGEAMALAALALMFHRRAGMLSYLRGVLILVIIDPSKTWAIRSKLWEAKPE